MDTMQLTERVSRVMGREIDRFYVRSVLRAMFPEDAPGRGGQWDVSDRQARVIEASFRELRAYETGR